MLSDTLKEKIESLPAILSIRETADFFSVAYLTIYRLIRMEKLPAWKDDEGNWCIARSDLLKFCSKNSNL
ncbi:MAG: helix-turn-helix domain-containing protein [Treponema sp.]|jgi:excisionase family DNA binding protein|nr:helix-turn-helix domain-containing protein [Treponema sp.]